MFKYFLYTIILLTLFISQIHAGTQVKDLTDTSSTISSEYFTICDDGISTTKCSIDSINALNKARRYATFVVAAYNSSTLGKASADYVATSASDGITKINAAIAALPATGGKVVLLDGTYQGTDGATFGINNVTLEGQGKNTIIQRTTGNDWYVNPARTGIVIKDLSYTQKSVTTGSVVSIINCWENGIYIPSEGKAVILTKYSNTAIVERRSFATVAEAITATTGYADTVRFLMEIYGYHNSTDTLQFTKSYLDIIGYNAKVRYSSNIDSRAASFPAMFNGTVQDVTFESVGTGATLSNRSVVEVGSTAGKFINVKAINNFVSTADPVNPDDTAVYAGNRLHGLHITGSATFINCEGRGSNSGNHDTRGIYIESDETSGSISPTLINCYGYGGGVKGVSGHPTNRCHGIIIHTGANPTLINCVGIAGGDASGAESSGIKFQGLGSGRIISSIGYGKSTGSGGIYADYYTSPTLINSIGYAGKNDGAIGLYIGGYSFPTVLGGYFGPTELEADYAYTAATGKFQLDTAAHYLNAVMLYVMVARAGITVDLGTTVGGTDIATGASIATAGWVYLTFTPTAIAAGEYVYVTPSGSVTDGDFRVIAKGINNSAIIAGKMDTAGAAKITGASFRSPPAGSGIYLTSTMNSNTGFYLDKLNIDCDDDTKNAINCQSAFTSLPLTNSKIKGAINGVTSYLNTAIEGSSNYR